MSAVAMLLVVPLSGPLAWIAAIVALLAPAIVRIHLGRVAAAGELRRVHVQSPRRPVADGTSQSLAADR